MSTLLFCGGAGAADARVSVGQKLFFDPRLSADGSISCASCHLPALSFSDGKRVAEGIGGRSGTRNTPSLINVGTQKFFFWDGRRDSLSEQVKAPLLNAVEHGLPDEASVARILKTEPEYGRMFKKAYPRLKSDPGMEEVAQALTSFIKTLRADASPFARFQRGDRNALSAEAKRGFEVFSGDAGCSSCHSVGGKTAELTDHEFHTLGVGLEPYREQLPALSRRVVQASKTELETLISTDGAVAELGRFVATLDPADIGKFKTPALYNVELTAPYMHDGSVATLSDAIDHEVYYRGLSRGRAAFLTEQDKNALLAFLRSLTDESLRKASPP